MRRILRHFDKLKYHDKSLWSKVNVAKQKRLRNKLYIGDSELYQHPIWLLQTFCSPSNYFQLIIPSSLYLLYDEKANILMNSVCKEIRKNNYFRKKFNETFCHFSVVCYQNYWCIYCYIFTILSTFSLLYCTKYVS